MPKALNEGPFVGEVDGESSVAETLSSLGKQMLPDYMLLANRLMKEMAQKKRIRNTDDFAANFFLPLYESITGRRVKDAIMYPRGEKDTARNLVLLLDQLSSDLQNISLSHIRVEDLLSGDRVATCNLLEILQGLTEYTIKKNTGTGSHGNGDEPLSTFRSLNSNATLCEDSIDSYQCSSENSPRKDMIKNPSSRRSPLPFELPTRLPAGHSDRPHSPVSRGQSPSVAQRAVLVESFSMGSSVSGATDDGGEQDLSPASSKESIKRLRRQMVRAEKRAERVGLIAQLLSNCALVDKIKARSGRRALSQLDLDDNASEMSDLVPSLDDAQSDDSASIDDSTVCDSVESLQGRSGSHDSDSTAREACQSLEVGPGYCRALKDAMINEKKKLRALRENIPPTPKERKKSKSLAKFDRRRPTGSYVSRRLVPLRRKARPSNREQPDTNVHNASRRKPSEMGLLDYLVQELPGMSLSDSALRRLQRYVHPMLADPDRPAAMAEQQRAAATRRLMAEACRREAILGRMVRREIAAENRLREIAERRAAGARLRADERNARVASARASRYGEQMLREIKSLRMTATSNEEDLLRETLTEGSKLERQHRLELEREVREAEGKHSNAIKGGIELLENFYRDQMCELTESAKDEKESIEVEAKAKRMQNSQMRQELRVKLESDIRNFQASLRSDVDDAKFFRRLDAERALDRRQKSLRRK